MGTNILKSMNFVMYAVAVMLAILVISLWKNKKFNVIVRVVISAILLYICFGIFTGANLANKTLGN